MIKSRHADSGVHHTVISEEALETQEPGASLEQSISQDSASTNSALVPLENSNLSIPLDFDAELAKIEMWTSYTGPVPAKLDEYYNVPVEVVGMIKNRISSEKLDEVTGEVTIKQWDEIRLKLSDGKVIAASGQGARQFANIVLPSLGQGDWPYAIKVLVKARTLGNGHPIPAFQVLGKV